MATKSVIGVYENRPNGQKLGYIKSVSYKNNSYQTTRNKATAKKYSFEAACNEVDELTTICMYRYGRMEMMYSIE